MSAPFNLSRYNLMGYNVTPINEIFTSVKAYERVNFISVSTTTNVFPVARAYTTITKGTLRITLGRFSQKTNSSISIDLLKADLIGYSWRKVTAAENITGSFIGWWYFWMKLNTSDSFDASAQLLGCLWRQAETLDKIDCQKAELLGYSWRQVTAAENITGTFTGWWYFWRKLSTSDAIDCNKANIAGCSWRQAETLDEIDCANADVLSYFWQKLTIQENITGAFAISNNALISMLSSDVLTGKLKISQKVLSPAAASTEITMGNRHLSQYVMTNGETLDLIDAISSVESLELKTCVLTLTLKPGQTLIVDANTYNVWIDGENAVYTHSGDWLDELDRNTQKFEITAGTNLRHLSASILYTERYL